MENVENNNTDFEEKRYKIEKLRNEKGYHNGRIVAGFVSLVVLQYILSQSNITAYTIEEFNSTLSELPFKKMLLQGISLMPSLSMISDAIGSKIRINREIIDTIRENGGVKK